jgi:O-antigen/teichoic acid export membrane protein
MQGRADQDAAAGYRRGAALLSVGIGASGLLTYAYFALASHALDPDEYGTLVLLWSVLFISVFTLYRPVEQFVSRSVAERDAVGLEHGSAIRVAASIQIALALGFVAVGLLLRGPIEDGLLSGDGFLYAILMLAAPAYAVSFFARGYLAGSGYFGLYGAMLLLEAGSRFAMAAVATVGLTGGGSAIAFGILLAPLVSLTVVPLVAFGRGRPGSLAPAPADLDPIGEEPASPVGAGMSLGKGGSFVGSAFLIMLSEQALLNAGVLVVAVTLNEAAAGLLFNVMLIARAPQVLFGAVTTSLLPSLSRLWVERERDGGRAFRVEVRDTVVAVAVLSGAAVGAVAVLGPALMQVTFGDDHSYDRIGLVVVAAGMGFHLTALTLTQSLLARDYAPSAAACWVGCALGFVAFSFLSIFGEVRQVEVGYALATASLSACLFWLFERTGRTA